MAAGFTWLCGVMKGHCPLIFPPIAPIFSAPIYREDKKCRFTSTNVTSVSTSLRPCRRLATIRSSSARSVGRMDCASWYLQRHFASVAQAGMKPISRIRKNRKTSLNQIISKVATALARNHRVPAKRVSPLRPRLLPRALRQASHRSKPGPATGWSGPLNCGIL